MRDKNLLIAILAIFCLSTTLNGSLRASESQSPSPARRAMNGLLSGINLLARVSAAAHGGSYYGDLIPETSYPQPQEQGSEVNTSQQNQGANGSWSSTPRRLLGLLRGRSSEAVREGGSDIKDGFLQGLGPSIQGGSLSAGSGSGSLLAQGEYEKIVDLANQYHQGFSDKEQMIAKINELLPEVKKDSSEDLVSPAVHVMIAGSKAIQYRLNELERSSSLKETIKTDDNLKAISDLTVAVVVTGGPLGIRFDRKSRKKDIQASVKALYAVGLRAKKAYDTFEEALEALATSCLKAQYCGDLGQYEAAFFDHKATSFMVVTSKLKDMDHYDDGLIINAITENLPGYYMSSQKLTRTRDHYEGLMS